MAIRAYRLSVDFRTMDALREFFECVVRPAFVETDVEGKQRVIPVGLRAVDGLDQRGGLKEFLVRSRADVAGHPGRVQ